MKIKKILTFIIAFAVALSMFLPNITYAENSTAVVNVDTLNVREKPSADAKKLGSLKKGTKVTVYSTSNGWSEISFNKKKGYVLAEYLGFQTTSFTTATVNVDTLNVREKPSVDAKKLGSLKKGTKVTVYVTSNGWSEVSFDKRKGYVSSDYLDFQTSASTTATVSVDTLNVREKPSANSKKLGSLKKGTKVTVYSTSDGWSEISFNKQKGYILFEYVDFHTTLSYTSYKMNPDKVYKYRNYELVNNKPTDITYTIAKYVGKEKDGDFWSNGFIWKEDSEGLMAMLGYGYNGEWETLLLYPIKKGDKWKNDGYSFENEIISVDKTVKTIAGTFENCVVVDYDYVVLTFAEGVGLIKIEARGGLVTELESITNN